MKITQLRELAQQTRQRNSAEAWESMAIICYECGLWRDAAFCFRRAAQRRDEQHGFIQR